MAAKKPAVKKAAPKPAVNKPKTIAVKATKAEIQELQRMLGVTPDGIMGPKTKAAIKALQTKLGVPADGIIGPITLAAARTYTKAANDTEKAVAAAGRTVTHPPANDLGPLNAVYDGIKTTPVNAVATPLPAAFAQPLSQLSPTSRALAALQLNTFAALPPTAVNSDDYNALVQNLSAALGPQIQQLSDALTQRAVSTAATDASNAQLENTQRWTDAAETQAKILSAIRDLAVKVMAKDKISQRIYRAYGVVLP